VIEESSGVTEEEGKEMFIVATVTYPPDKAVQITKKFLKAAEKPLPSFIKPGHVLTAPGGERGIKVLVIYEVDDKKFKEGVKEIAKRYVPFYDVEGFRYNFEVMLSTTEAIPILGI
jgi:hypothetical protein